MRPFGLDPAAPSRPPLAGQPQLTPSRRGEAISARRQAEAGWSAKHAPGIVIDPAWARTVLRPALAIVPLSTVTRATGAAKSTASGWRNGRSVPNPMHWRTLAELVGLKVPAGLVKEVNNLATV